VGDERHDMTVVLTQRILQLMRRSIHVARSPLVVVLASKDPGVVFLLFDYEDTRVSDKDDVNLRRAALIRNNDVPECEERETPRDRCELSSLVRDI